MVELADGVRAGRIAQQRVVGLQAGVAGLVVQGGVVAGDDAGGVECVHVAGAAGPCHLKAGDGDKVGVRGVERRDGIPVGLPSILAVGGGEAHVVERTLGVGGAGLVEVVGVVGEGHEVDVRLIGQARHIFERRIQRAGTVGIGGVGVELAEVELVLRRAHGEGPGLAGFLAVRALDGDRHVHAAVGHVGFGLIADHAVLVPGRDRLAVQGHGDLRRFAGVYDLGGDDGALVLAGLAARGGRQVGEDRLVENGDRRIAGKRDTGGVHARDADGEGLPARQRLGGNGDAVGLAVLFHHGLRRGVQHDHGCRRI